MHLPITARSYFKFSMLYPLFVPWICMIGVDTVVPRDTEVSRVLIFVGLSFFGSLIVYLPTALVLFPWIGRCSLRTLHVTVLTAPLIAIGSLLLITVVISAISAISAFVAGGSPGDVLALGLGMFVLFSFYVLLFGYAYVAITYIIYLPLRLARLVRI